jgi:hypothetical protein
MSRAECPREQEVLDALSSNRWPDRLGDDLWQHVEGCAFCKDLGLVAQALSADFSTAIQQARIPSAGLVWWRAEIRARQDSIQTASRPITLAHYIGVACAGLVALALSSLFDFGGLTTLSGFSLSGLIPDFLSIPLSLPLILATLGAVAVLASVVLYLVLSDN